MLKVVVFVTTALAIAPTAVKAQEFTLILKNGTNPECNIVAGGGSRVIVDNRIVNLSRFDADDGTYTYQWTSSFPTSTVAIQVDLANMHQPDVWLNPGCVYAPVFDENQTTFTQQYLEPDPIVPYTCTCRSQWNE